MTKRIIMCIIASAMICGSFASCGKDADSESKSSVASNTAETTDAAETEAATVEKTEADATTDEDTETTTEVSNNDEVSTDAVEIEATTSESTDEDTSDEHISDAVAVLNALNSIDGIGGGAGIETDSADTKQEGTATYERVSDSRFTTVDDVKKYVTDSICGTLLDRYKFLYEGEEAYFKDYNGTLYFKNNPRGSGFSYTGEPIITDATENSFTVTIAFDNFGGSSDLKVKAVKEDGLWKASSFSIDGGAENSR